MSAEALSPNPANGLPTSPAPASPAAPRALGNAPRGTVYLLHFDQRYEHAGHYTGWTEDLPARLDRHQAGRGARLIEVITQAGIGFRLARTWPGVSKARERQLKNRGGASRHCPLCQQQHNGHDRPDRSSLVTGAGDRAARGNGHRDRQPATGRPSTSAAVPTRGVTPAQARRFMTLNPAFARPVRASLAKQWGRVRGREEIETLSPRVTATSFEENQQLTQQRAAAIRRRAHQARDQAHQQQLADRAEQQRARTLATRTHQQLTTRQPSTRAQRQRGGRGERTTNAREAGHER